MKTSQAPFPRAYTSIGGQAVIEGVMMRSPGYVAVAVRKPDGKIALRARPYTGLTKRYSWLGLPVLRGIATLIESMVQGVEALSYSAGIAVAEPHAGPEKGTDAGASSELSDWAIAGSIASALVVGLGLFVALPHFLTLLVESARSPWFHLIDGALKMAILLGYVYAIAMMNDIRRVFEYHGAEHKSIYAFEAGEELTVENARRHTTLHPRCGTSFLLFLVLISIIVFSVVFPVFGLNHLARGKLANNLAMIGIKIVLMLPVAGLSYEFIKACACRMQNPLFRALIWPGLMLQHLTTREPSDDQLEVALASLRQALRLEKSAETEAQPERVISLLSDLAPVAASAAEFPEL